jgi:RNA polymerase sigma-70 factor (ECF subfamily)
MPEDRDSVETPDQPTSSKGPSRKAQDQALVEAARAGDNRAYGQLVETYQRRVYALAFGMLRHREDAWDVAQEAFVKAYKNLDKFEGHSAFYTWLYRITYNVAMDHLRYSKRRETVDMDQHELEQHIEDDKGHNFSNPLESLDRKELRGVLARAMDELSEKHRAIIVLREVEGLSYEEMADVLKISKGTVMSRLFHARKNLQKLLEPYLAERSGASSSRLVPQGAA